MKKIIILVCAFSLIVAFFSCSGKTDSQKAKEAWPTDKVTVIIPWAEGGAADKMARLLIKYWEPELGTEIIVDNRKGAATLTGTTLFTKQPADGNTLFISTQLYFSAGEVLKNADYKVSDFDILNIQQMDPITITVHKDSSYDTLEDLIEDIKARPGEVKWGTIFGGAMHVAGEILKRDLRLDIKPVRYDNGNDIRTALLEKDVDFIISNANGDLALKGQVKVLALAGDDRLAIWPDTPTMNEALKKYALSFPFLGSARFVAVHSKLKEDYPERYKKLLETYKTAFHNLDYQEELKNSGEGAVTKWFGPEQSKDINNMLHQIVKEYKDVLIE